MASEPPVTILVPTFNRPGLLDRWFAHLVRDKNPFPVLIADGSVAENAEQNAEVIGRFASRLDIRYLRFEPDYDVIDRIRDALAQVSTPLVQLHADDDFLFSAGVSAAAGALMADDTIAAAQGMLMTVRSKPGTLVIRPYYFTTLQQESAATRLRAHLHAYRPTFYATCRTQVLVRAFTLAALFLGHSDRLRELAISALVVACGKTVFVPALHGLRTTHADAVSASLSTWSEVVRTEGFKDSATLFCDVVGEELALREGCQVEAAREAAREALLDYLATATLKKKLMLPEFVGQSQLVRAFFTGERPDANERIKGALRTLV